jgi:hypothetical protein
LKLPADAIKRHQGSGNCAGHGQATEDEPGNLWNFLCFHPGSKIHLHSVSSGIVQRVWSRTRQKVTKNLQESVKGTGILLPGQDIERGYENLRQTLEEVKKRKKKDGWLTTDQDRHLQFMQGGPVNICAPLVRYACPEAE